MRSEGGPVLKGGGGTIGKFLKSRSSSSKTNFVCYRKMPGEIPGCFSFIFCQIQATPKMTVKCHPDCRISMLRQYDYKLQIGNHQVAPGGKLPDKSNCFVCDKSLFTPVFDCAQQQSFRCTTFSRKYSF